MVNLKKILTDMQEYASIHNVPIISPEGSRLLQEVADAAKPLSVLELGTAIGYSTLLLATSMKQGGQITTIEQDEERISIAKHFITQTNLVDQINFIAGDAGAILPELTGKYDLVFIDAAKGQYLDYLRKVLDKLSPGAVILADNVLFRGWVLGNSTAPRRFRTIVKRLRDYLDFVTTDKRFKTVVHHIGDGIAVSYYQGETSI